MAFRMGRARLPADGQKWQNGQREDATTSDMKVEKYAVMMIDGLGLGTLDLD